MHRRVRLISSCRQNNSRLRRGRASSFFLQDQNFSPDLFRLTRAGLPRQPDHRAQHRRLPTTYQKEIVCNCASITIGKYASLTIGNKTSNIITKCLKVLLRAFNLKVWLRG